MYCSNCGKEIEDNAKFCKFCGNSVTITNNLNDDKNLIIEKQEQNTEEVGRNTNSLNNKSHFFKFITTKKSIFLIFIWLIISLGPIRIFLINEAVNNIDATIFSLFFCMVILYFIYSLFSLPHKIKTLRAEVALAERMQIKNLEHNEFKINLQLKHVNGLPIPENTICTILIDSDNYKFSANGVIFNLERNKITDITIKTDIEIQQQAVSSIGGAVAGGILFGPIGAIIGGRAKIKKIATTTEYLIITYLVNGEIKYIGFENEGLKALEILDDFDCYKSHNIQKNKSVEL